MFKNAIKDEDNPLHPLMQAQRELVGERRGLVPRDYMILGLLFEGKSAGEIGARFGVKGNAILRRMARPQFQKALRAAQDQMLERINRGEFGALAIYKAQLVPAAKRIVRIAKRSENDRVRLDANMHIEKMGGMQPPTPKIVDNPETLINQFTAEEAHIFAETGVFPERFRDQFARLGANILQKRETEAATAAVVEAHEFLEPTPDPTNEDLHPFGPDTHRDPLPDADED